jgi:hypothetical protein
MKTKILFGLVILSIIILFQCSEKKDPLSVSTHPDGWNNSTSANFHGKAITDGSLGQESCQTCHGVDYSGGTSGVSCSNSFCHQQYPHPEDWLNSGSSNFHGNTSDNSYCQKCHGSDYQGGSSGVSCYTCHNQFPHPTGWLQTENQNFHGNFILSDVLSLQECQRCHGEDYTGGSSGIACFTCHVSYPHPEGFGSGASENFHSGYISTEANWDIVPCRSCHGADYAGNGFSEKNCLKCHPAPDGPEACNTCHGSSDNAAPPVNLLKMTSSRELTIGAHQEHVVAGTWSTFSRGTCRTCHKEPTRYDDAGHIDDTPHAEVIFNSLATDAGRLNTTWDRLRGSCDNVYCHGPFEFKKSDSQYPWAYTDSVMVGSNPRLFWQFPGTNQVLCGTCHGIPPQGHAPVTSCKGCHASVVDENLNIINKYRHINGKIDVFN